MTLIVAIVSDSGSIVFGSDCGGYHLDTREYRHEPKVFQLNGLVIGYAGSFRIGQLIQYSLAGEIGVFMTSLVDQFERTRSKATKSLDIPEIDESAVVLGLLVTQFVPSLMRLLKKQGCLKVEDHVKEMECELLIGLPMQSFTSRGYIYKVEANFQVSEIIDFGCIGAASSFALGALGAVQHVKYLDAIDAAKLGLEVASKHSSVVMEPFKVLEL